MSDTHSAALQHHFEDMEQQNAAANMGMWAFIAQEIMFFGGLFGGYTVYRYKYFDAFTTGSHTLPIQWGATTRPCLVARGLPVLPRYQQAQRPPCRGRYVVVFSSTVRLHS